jgi:hypothetical protein
MATVHAAILFPVRHAVAVAVTSLFPAKQPYLPNYKTSRQKQICYRQDKKYFKFKIISRNL